MVDVEEKEKYSYEDYNEVLDCEGTINVCGYEMFPSTILEQCDPIAYQCGYSDCQEYTYICGGCDTEYDEYDDAHECCKEDE